jgi:hypothetical protein
VEGAAYGAVFTRRRCNSQSRRRRSAALREPLPRNGNERYDFLTGALPTSADFARAAARLRNPHARARLPLSAFQFFREQGGISFGPHLCGLSGFRNLRGLFFRASSCCTSAALSALAFVTAFSAGATLSAASFTSSCVFLSSAPRRAPASPAVFPRAESWPPRARFPSSHLWFGSLHFHQPRCIREFRRFCPRISELRDLRILRFEFLRQFSDLGLDLFGSVTAFPVRRLWPGHRQALCSPHRVPDHLASAASTA